MNGNGFHLRKIKLLKHLPKSLNQLTKIERHRHHPLLHKLHKKHGISRKTLLYVKEYGPHSHVAMVIIKESLKVLLLASLLSAFGGFALEEIKTLFVSIIPLVILLPALNDMIGDYGTIVSSRLSTMLHEGVVQKKWWQTPELKEMFLQIAIVSMITAALSSVIAMIIPVFTSGYDIALGNAVKIFVITIVDVAVLVSLLFFTSIYAGLRIYKKKEDPNNFLIPITTSIADFGNMAVLALLVMLFF